MGKPTPIFLYGNYDYWSVCICGSYQNVFIKKEKFGHDYIYVMNMNDILALSIKMFNKNPYAILKHEPKFILGKIPMDGFSIKNEDEIHNYWTGKKIKIN